MKRILTGLPLTGLDKISGLIKESCLKGLLIKNNDLGLQAMFDIEGTLVQREPGLGGV